MTRRLAALSLLGLACLSYLAQANPVPAIAPSEALAWEGQAAAVRGVVRDRRILDGMARFDLVLDGHALAVRLDGALVPADGTPIVAEGRLARLGGTLTLLADRLALAPLEPSLQVSLSALAADPDLWRNQVVVVQGIIEQGHLRADGHRIALGSGEWSSTGLVQASVLLTYDAKCACQRLDRVAA